VTEVTYQDDTHLIAKLKGDSREWDITYPKASAGDTFKGLSDAKVSVKPQKEKGFPWALCRDQGAQHRSKNYSTHGSHCFFVLIM